MENTSKSLLIVGVILIVIIIISLGIYIYENNTSITRSATNSGIEELELTKFNNQYVIYKGRQKGSNVKNLLQYASINNSELYKRKDTIQDCVCIRSKSKEIVNNIKDAEIKRGLTTREYGVRYPQNINMISSYIQKSKIYNVEFNYNEKRLYLGNLYR